MIELMEELEESKKDLLSQQNKEKMRIKQLNKIKGNYKEKEDYEKQRNEQTAEITGAEGVTVNAAVEQANEVVNEEQNNNENKQEEIQQNGENMKGKVLKKYILIYGTVI